MALNQGEPIAGRVAIAEPIGRQPTKPDPKRLLSLTILAMRLAREDLAAKSEPVHVEQDGERT
jgi:hypothetical protein